MPQTFVHRFLLSVGRNLGVEAILRKLLIDQRDLFLVGTAVGDRARRVSGVDRTTSLSWVADLIIRHPLTRFLEVALISSRILSSLSQLSAEEPICFTPLLAESAI